MKKLSLLAGTVLMSSMLFMGCSQKFSQTENKYIDMANSLAEKQYNAKIDKDDYSYNIGKEIKSNEYIPMEDNETPKKVYVNAIIKNEPEKGDVINYSAEIDTETNKAVFMKAEVSK